MIAKIVCTLWLLSIFALTPIFAIEAPANLKIDSVNSVSATFSWEAVDNAAAYSIYYWEDSSNLTEYDLAEKSPYTILGLTNNTVYYASITSNDDSFEESTKSSPLKFTTWDTNSSSQTTTSDSSFALENVEIISEKKLKLSFNAALNDSEDSPREFKITNKFDELDELIVFDSEIDEQNENILILTMESSIPTSAQYNVTIVRLNDKNWNNIQNGIDGIASFRTPDNYETLVTPVDVEPELTSAGPEEAKTEVWWASSGQNISDEQLAQTTQATAGSAKKLPTTGAQHWFIGILALLLWIVLFKFRVSK